MSKKIVLRLWAPAVLAALAVLVIAGCGSSGSSSSSTASSETTSGGGSTSGSEASEGSGEAPKAAVLYQTVTDFTTPQVEGIEKEIDAAGGSIQEFNSNFNPQKQLEQCQDAITSGRYNVIVISAADSPSAVPCAEQAKGAGIPVVAIQNPVGKDRDKVAPQIDSVLGSAVVPQPENAELTFEIVEKACKGNSHCKLVIEMGEGSNPLDTPELEEDAKKSSNIELVQVTEGHYNPGATAESVPQILSANPDLDVYVFESDTNALAAVAPIKEAGLSDQVKIVSDGGSTAGVEGVKKGTIYGTVAFFPITMGEEAGRMAVEAVQKGTVENDAVSMFELGEPLLIYKENAAEFEAQWGEG
ncbi:MAG: sugar ABC transporter substrate-binding protein [Solirubrobacterales bacterium]